MSVGHVARAIEASGIPTVSVFVRSFRHLAQTMGVPRTVITRHPMGRPMGAPRDRLRQTAVLNAAWSFSRPLIAVERSWNLTRPSCPDDLAPAGRMEMIQMPDGLSAAILAAASALDPYWLVFSWAIDLRSGSSDAHTRR